MGRAAAPLLHVSWQVIDLDSSYCKSPSGPVTPPARLSVSWRRRCAVIGTDCNYNNGASSKSAPPENLICSMQFTVCHGAALEFSIQCQRRRDNKVERGWTGTERMGTREMTWAKGGWQANRREKERVYMRIECQRDRVTAPKWGTVGASDSLDPKVQEESHRWRGLLIKWNAYSNMGKQGGEGEAEEWVVRYG